MAKIDTDEWEARAWEGVLVEVPPEWDIAAISGERKRGYMRIDDQDNMPRVEVKWQESKGFVNVDEVIEKYLKDLQKKRPPDADPVEVDHDCTVVSKRQMRKRDLNCFAWHEEISGYGAAWYCEDCERAMVIQVMVKPEEDGQDLAAEVIGNMEDHPVDGWVTWSTYGLKFQTPERFDLSQQKLMAGLIELTFEDSGEQIVAARWGMANIALGGGSLEGWAEREIKQFHKGVRLEFEQTQFRGHPAVHVTGTFVNPLRYFQSFVMHVLRRPYAEVVNGWAWHSEEENRIYYVGTLLDEKNTDIAEEIARRVDCPEGEVGEEDEHEGKPIR